MDNHVICEQNFISFFPISIYFTSFSCLVALARISNAKLKKSGEWGHPCLVPDLTRKASSFLPLSMLLAVGFLLMCFIKRRKFPSIPNLLRIFIMDWCCISSNAFSKYIDMIVWFLFFSLLMWWITLIWFQILSQLCIPGINPTWSWCIILFIHC